MIICFSSQNIFKTCLPSASRNYFAMLLKSITKITNFNKKIKKIKTDFSKVYQLTKPPKFGL